MALTDLKREYYQSVLVGMGSLVSLPGPVQKKQLQRITLSAPSFIVQQHLLPQIQQLEKVFPNLDLNIVAEHKVANLMNADVDLAIQYGFCEGDVKVNLVGDQQMWSWFLLPLLCCLNYLLAPIQSIGLVLLIWRKMLTEQSGLHYCSDLNPECLL